MNGLNLSENKDKNKEDIINNNISNYPMDTIEYNKDIDNGQEEIKKSINIFNSENNFLDNIFQKQETNQENNAIFQKQETNQENNAQSFSVQNSSANPENETNK